jgi:hypothetical protein
MKIIDSVIVVSVALFALEVGAQQTVVELDAGVIPSLKLESNTIYQGNLPQVQINTLAVSMVQTGVIPAGIVDEQYTVIENLEGDHMSIWAVTNTTVTGVQLRNLESLGYIGGGNNSFTGNLVYCDTGNCDGFEADPIEDISWNIFVGLNYGVKMSAVSGWGIRNNFFGFGDMGLAIVLYADMGQAENILFKNTHNAGVWYAQVDYESVLEGNWWYDWDGVLLDTENRIFEGITVNTGEFPSKSFSSGNKSSLDPEGYVDVVPFRTDNPFKVMGLPAAGIFVLVVLGVLLVCAGIVVLKKKQTA